MGPQSRGAIAITVSVRPRFTAITKPNNEVPSTRRGYSSAVHRPRRETTLPRCGLVGAASVGAPRRLYAEIAREERTPDLLTSLLAGRGRIGG